MSWETMTWAKAQTTGSVGRKAVLMALAEYADERHSCYPSQDTLARETEQSERTIRNALADLQAQGLVTVEHRGGTGAGRQSNRYVLNVEQLPATVAVRATGNRQPQGGANGNLGSSEHHRTPRAKAIPPTPRPAADGSNGNGSGPATPNRLPVVYSDEFEAAWELYPYRRGTKKAAWRAWQATVRREGRDVRPLLHTATVNYAASVKAERTAEKYVKHGATFYGPDEHWREYLDGARTASATVRYPTPEDPDFLPETMR